MTTSESKGRFFLQNESIRITNRIDSNRELECSTVEDITREEKQQRRRRNSTSDSRLLFSYHDVIQFDLSFTRVSQKLLSHDSDCCIMQRNVRERY